MVQLALISHVVLINASDRFIWQTLIKIFRTISNFSRLSSLVLALDHQLGLRQRKVLPKSTYRWTLARQQQMDLLQLTKVDHLWEWIASNQALSEKHEIQVNKMKHEKHQHQKRKVYFQVTIHRLQIQVLQVLTQFKIDFQAQEAKTANFNRLKTNTIYNSAIQFYHQIRI